MFSHIVFPVHERPVAPTKAQQKEFQKILAEGIAMFKKITKKTPNSTCPSKSLSFGEGFRVRPNLNFEK